MGRKRKNFKQEEAPKIEEKKKIEEVPPLSEHEIEEHEKLDREYFDTLPPGYRFKPTSEELIEYYLKKKVSNSLDMPCNRIRVTNIYSLGPQDLTSRYRLHREKEWYFFTPRTKKYPNGKRPDRRAGDGIWKATGADVDVHDDEGVKIGTRKTLVYYKGKAKDKDGVKTNWIMHEYRHKANNTDSAGPVAKRLKTNANDMKLDDVVLCKIYHKTPKTPKKRVSNQIPNEVGDDNATNTPTPASSLLPSSSPMPTSCPLQASSPVQNQQVPNSNPRLSSTQDTLAAIIPGQNAVGQVPFQNQGVTGFGNTVSFQTWQNDHLPNPNSEPGPDGACFDNMNIFQMPASSHLHASFPWQTSFPGQASFPQIQHVPNPEQLDIGYLPNTHELDDITSMPNPIQSVPFSQSFSPGNFQAMEMWNPINPNNDLVNSLPYDTHSQFDLPEPIDDITSMPNPIQSLPFSQSYPDYLLCEPLDHSHGQLSRLDDAIQWPDQDHDHDQDQALSSKENIAG